MFFKIQDNQNLPGNEKFPLTVPVWFHVSTLSPHALITMTTHCFLDISWPSITLSQTYMYPHFPPSEPFLEHNSSVTSFLKFLSFLD